jgi:exodeoxyribonuclease-5
MAVRLRVPDGILDVDALEAAPRHELTREQHTALDDLVGGLKAGWRTITFGGYAGTGKTTVLGMLPSVFSGRIRFASYTGKAASVMSGKLPPGSRVSTLHNLLYLPVETVWRDPDTDKMHSKTEFVPKEEPLAGYDLVVVDEASMVPEWLWDDLTSWGVPVLAVGDHAQLPPVNSRFDLMADPDICLETVMRQVANSPIIRMATLAREYGDIPFGDYGRGCRKIRRGEAKGIAMTMRPEKGDMVLCGRNSTRIAINKQFRLDRGLRGKPVPGDVVICLRNNSEEGIFNGQRGIVETTKPFTRGADAAMVDISMMDSRQRYFGIISLEQFNNPSKDMYRTRRDVDLFDYGYAMTVHKAQGSEADRVLVQQEKLSGIDHSRWLYTAVTRAARKLVVVSVR